MRSEVDAMQIHPLNTQQIRNTSQRMISNQTPSQRQLVNANKAGWKSRPFKPFFGEQMIELANRQ